MGMDGVKTQQFSTDGREFLRVTMGEDIFDLPFKELGGKKVAFLDISGQFRLIESCADQLVQRLIDEGAVFDTILNPVSKSNALAHAIAVRWAERVNPALTHTVVARKSANSDGDENKKVASYRSVTTPVEQTLSLTPEDAAHLEGKRLLIVDDVYGGGGTFRALAALADGVGATIAAKAVVAIEGGAQNTEGITHLFILPTL